MIYKQCLFVDIFENNEDEIQFSSPHAGIAVYEDFCQGESPMMELRGVICAECGGWIEADDCQVVKTLDKWWSLEEAIEQNFYPDDTRGFRPENQIKMKFD